MKKKDFPPIGGILFFKERQWRNHYDYYNKQTTIYNTANKHNVQCLILSFSEIFEITVLCYYYCYCCYYFNLTFLTFPKHNLAWCMIQKKYLHSVANFLGWTGHTHTHFYVIFKLLLLQAQKTRLKSYLEDCKTLLPDDTASFESIFRITLITAHCPLQRTMVEKWNYCYLQEERFLGYFSIHFSLLTLITRLTRSLLLLLYFLVLVYFLALIIFTSSLSVHQVFRKMFILRN